MLPKSFLTRSASNVLSMLLCATMLVGFFFPAGASAPMSRSGAQSETFLVKASVRVAVLVQDAAALDPDEANLRDFLQSNGFEFGIIDAEMIKSGAAALSGYDALYMRTGSEPTGYNDPEILNQIQAAVESGANLVLEYFGFTLGQYLGVGTVTMYGWRPLVLDTTYFVEAIASGPILEGILPWSPPVLPDRPEQLVSQMKRTAYYSVPILEFTSTPQAINYWILFASYGWSQQPTDSEYCLQHPGACTPDRSVWLTNDNKAGQNDGIEYIHLGQGKIYKLGLSLATLVSVNDVERGPVALQMRRNVLLGQATRYPLILLPVILREK